MKRSDVVTGLLRDHEGLIVRREHRAHRAAIQRALSAGRLQVLAPGVLGPAGVVPLHHRVEAVVRSEPDAVITGAVAASLGWWPEAIRAADQHARFALPQAGSGAFSERPVVGPVTTAPGFRGPLVVQVAHPRPRQAAHGLAWQERRIPPEWILEEKGVRLTNPALTALDLIPLMGGRIVDEALRLGVLDLPDLEEALVAFPNRRGNGHRRTILEDSRDRPWSEPERDLHRQYRSLLLPYEYRTNYRVDLPDGTHRLLDLAIPRLCMGFEVDGYTYHSSRTAFTRDRVGDVLLATIGWVRHRFDASMVVGNRAWTTATMRKLVEAREALLGLSES